MKYLAALLLIFGFGLSGFGQTIKSLGFNTTNGQVIADTGTNRLIITNVVQFNPANVTFKSSDGIYNSGKVLWVEPLSDTVVKGYDSDSGDTPIKFFGGVTAGGYGIPGPSLTPFGLGFSTDIVIGKINGTNFNWEYAPTFTNTAQETRANLGFSTNINALWTATNASNARSSINLGASWLTNTNATNFRADIGFSTNLTSLWTATNASNARSAVGLSASWLTNTNITNYRTAIGLGLSALTNTNVTNFRSAIGLGWSALTNTNATNFRSDIGFSTNLTSLWTATNDSNARSAINLSATWLTNTNVTNFRTDIELGDTNAVSFSGIYNNGNFTNINGTIYGLKTNVGPFEGIGNFFASNNTTVSNETLFRVGLAEATNKSAQFGFRVTRTNNGGEGVAVYSVFGYNALMMIGPSDRSRTNYATNTNAGVEATLWTITPTNQVMTLRDTNTGATTLHQSLGFDTNVTSTAPADTTNIVKWIEVWVGTNSYRMPLYQ